MNTYEKEGKISEAIATGNEALDVIEAYSLYETTIDGPMIRGSIRGDLARLEGKFVFTYTPRYSETEPLEMNLSYIEQLRAHIATAIIGTALTRAIESQLPYPRLEIKWSDGTVEIIPLLGAIIGWLLSNNILEQASEAMHQLTGRDKRYCLQAGLNLLTFVGFIYVIISPFILSDALLEIVLSIPLLVTMMLSFALINKHFKQLMAKATQFSNRFLRK